MISPWGSAESLTFEPVLPASTALRCCERTLPLAPPPTNPFSFTDELPLRTPCSTPSLRSLDLSLSSSLALSPACSHSTYETHAPVFTNTRPSTNGAKCPQHTRIHIILPTPPGRTRDKELLLCCPEWCRAKVPLPRDRLFSYTTSAEQIR